MGIGSFKKSLRALYGPHANSTDTDAKNGADRAYQTEVVVELSTAANATTNTDAQYFSKALGAKTVLAADYFPDAALDLSSDNGTNSAEFEIAKADGAAGSTTVVASVDTSGSATNLVVGVPYSLTLSCTSISDGEVLTARIGKNGTGHAITAGRFRVHVEEV